MGYPNFRFPADVQFIRVVQRGFHGNDTPSFKTLWKRGNEFFVISCDNWGGHETSAFLSDADGKVRYYRPVATVKSYDTKAVVWEMTRHGNPFTVDGMRQIVERWLQKHPSMAEAELRRNLFLPKKAKASKILATIHEDIHEDIHEEPCDELDEIVELCHDKPDSPDVRQPEMLPQVLSHEMLAQEILPQEIVQQEMIEDEILPHDDE
jgi:serine/threonine protein phosphatase PrpC